MSEQVKPKFNLIDLILILAVVALILTAVLRSGVVKKVGEAQTDSTVEITYMAQNLPQSVALALKANDVIYDADSGEKIGTLTYAAEPTPYEFYTDNAEGLPVKQAANDSFNVRGTLTCTGIFREDGFYLNGNRYVAAGSVMQLSNAATELTVTVLSIRTVD